MHTHQLKSARGRPLAPDHLSQSYTSSLFFYTFISVRVFDSLRFCYRCLARGFTYSSRLLSHPTERWKLPFNRDSRLQHLGHVDSIKRRGQCLILSWAATRVLFFFLLARTQRIPPFLKREACCDHFHCDFFNKKTAKIPEER